MLVSDIGLKLIAEFEGFGPYLYNDPVGHATVAYGFLVHLGNYHEQRGICKACDQWPRKSDSKSQWVTPERGRELLREKVKPYAAAVEANSRKLTQGEFDALTSLCFNIGQGGYKMSSVRAAVNGGGDVCAELRYYVKGTDGVTYPGLVRRREAECVLFKSNAPEPPMEDDEMKPFLAWNIDNKSVHLIGPFGSAWITQAADVAALEKLYGPMAVALRSAAITELRRT